MILIIPEPVNGSLNKGSYELATYAKLTAAKLNTEVHALVLGACDNAGELGKYGVDKVHVATNSSLDHFDSQSYAKAIADTATSIGAKVVIVRSSANGKALEGRLAVRLNADSVSGVSAVPDTSNGFTVSKSVYSGKAIATYSLNSDVKVLSLMGNAVQPQEVGSAITPSEISIEVATPKVKVIDRKVITGIVPLPEAEKVVSAGRGMKGPENWGIIEELAKELGATTACSRPVADTGWRPHHEHVGQTGVAIRPNLYIAVGISGAIQHLAGVNNSKTIVVINKDPEAPFFKAADYGIVGDLFDVVPRFIEALKKHKAS
jgi:electron transfer flavoprotein alpha subunit